MLLSMLPQKMRNDLEKIKATSEKELIARDAYLTEEADIGGARADWVTAMQELAIVVDLFIKDNNL